MPPTPAERKALLFLGTVALLGAGVRAVRAMRGGVEPPAQPALERQLAAAERVAVEARRAREAREAGTRKGGGRSRGRKAARPASPPAPPAPVDVDRADSAALDALPGVGPALAARIVRHRDSAGAFGHLPALDLVSGVGPGLLGRLAPHVTFSAPRRPLPGPSPGASPDASPRRQRGRARERAGA